MKSEGGIALSTREQFELNVLSRFRNGDLTRKEAATLLSISPRQVTRKSSKVAKHGVKGIVHGNTGRAPINKTPDDLKVSAVEAYRTTFANFNMVHALEKMKEASDIEVPYSNFQRWCDEAQIQKITYRRAKPRMFRERFQAEGIMLQMDGSPHKWNGRIDWCLINIIDDATSEVPHAEFFPAEDTLACMAVLRRVVEKKGIPVCMYVDKAGLYGGTAKRTDFSQFGRACAELGIEIIYAESAQGKGRVERSFRTCQDRLLAELHHAKLFTIPAANRYLHEVFLPKYWNSQLTVEPRSSKSHYRPVPKDVDLNEVFCLKETRQVKSDHTISIDCIFYQVTPPDSFSIANRNVEIRSYIDKPWKIFFNGRECAFRKLDKPPRQSAKMTAKISAEFAASKRRNDQKKRLSLVGSKAPSEPLNGITKADEAS